MTEKTEHLIEEQLDVVDEKGNPTGKVVSRRKAHECGIRHRTSHVWLIRKKDGKLQVLLQKRSEGKDSYPGCYDISSAGHIPAGVDFLPSALRELSEELGYHAKAEELMMDHEKRCRFGANALGMAQNYQMAYIAAEAEEDYRMILEERRRAEEYGHEAYEKKDVMSSVLHLFKAS